jgi:hypothetical protein
VAEPILDASRVVAGIGQGVAADVPQHVSVDRKDEADTRADALDQPGNRHRLILKIRAVHGGELGDVICVTPLLKQESRMRSGLRYKDLRSLRSRKTARR